MSCQVLVTWVAFPHAILLFSFWNATTQNWLPLNVFSHSCWKLHWSFNQLIILDQLLVPLQIWSLLSLQSAITWTGQYRYAWVSSAIRSRNWSLVLQSAQALFNLHDYLCNRACLHCAQWTFPISCCIDTARIALKPQMISYNNKPCLLIF